MGLGPTSAVGISPPLTVLGLFPSAGSYLIWTPSIEAGESTAYLSVDYISRSP